MTEQTLQLLGPLSDYTPHEVDSIIVRAMQITADRLLRLRQVEPAVATVRRSA
ncbi:hypothetical protein [Aeoliella mucimassa]|uniref:hypothetical protein n=1 Tax=Aeoliella mucimassa TaxID=2527972 RepID=UPI0018D419B8|nr:hypothetical protein [Aeoliella mucimassa]